MATVRCLAPVTKSDFYDFANVAFFSIRTPMLSLSGPSGGGCRGVPSAPAILLRSSHPGDVSEFSRLFSPLGGVDGSFCWKTKRRSQFQRTAVSDNHNTLGFYLARLTLAIATFNSSRERDTETKALSRSRTSSSTTLAQQQQVRPQKRRS